VRAETRRQLKEDRFSKVTFEAAGSAAHWSVEHQAKLITAVIAVVVIAAIAFGGWYYVNQQDEKASAELSTAVRTFDTPVRPAGVPAQPGYGSFASSDERATAARKQFQAIVDNYPHTHTADMARYFVGLASAQLNDNAAAERNLQEAAGSSNPDLAALGKFDEIFAVLNDDDGPKMKQVFDWAQTEGRDTEVSENLRDTIQSSQLSDRDIERKIDAMKAARTARDFKASDAIRTELTAAGIIIEQTKDGIRWRRK